MELEKGYAGIITEIDAENMLAKVVVPSFEDATTDWVMVNVRNNFFLMPQVGDQCIVWMDEQFEEGVIIAYVNNTKPYTDAKTIGFKFPGVSVEINIDSGATKIKLSGDAELEAPNFKLKGNMSLDGTLDVTGDATLKSKLSVSKDVAVTGKVDVNGIIKSMADVQTPTVKLNTHLHTSAAPGSPTTPPVPGT